MGTHYRPTGPVTIEEFFIEWNRYQDVIMGLITPDNMRDILVFMATERDRFYEWCDQANLHFKKPE